MAQFKQERELKEWQEKRMFYASIGLVVWVFTILMFTL